MTAKLDHEVADLKRRLDEALAERDEADAQRAALAEILEVINASPRNPASVFQRMLEKVMTLCGASFGELRTYDGERFSLAAAHGMPAAYTEYYARHDTGRYGPGTGPARLLAGERIIHIKDLIATEPYQRGDPDRHALVDLAGARAYVLVPLLLDGSVRGYILIFRQEPRPFTDKQIALLQNFAAQAVLAMENARVLSELSQRTTDLHESLEYQTATSNVLRVISRSDADLGSMLENLIATATRLCQADFGLVFRLHGDDRHHLIASYAATREFEEYLVANPFPQGRGTLTGRVAAERSAVVIEDAANDPEYTWTEGRQVGELRTGLGVPLLRDNILLGTFILYRSRVERFTEKQIKLVTTFADQAVIAIENARLLGELRQRTGDLQESLEYQTATSDVLKVMSGSAFELAPVLQTVVTTAVRLCRADQATIYRLDDGEYRWAADHSLAPDYERIERNVRIRPGTGTLVGRVALSRDTVQILDAWTDPLYEVKEDARIGGVHTMLGVPLIREGLPIGVIGLARRRIEPYTDKETELVRTFADQAVIAIENARLLGELRERTTDLQESLEYQTATSDVLKVISRSTFDLQPVLQTVVETATRLCEADMGFLLRREGDEYRAGAAVGYKKEYEQFMRTHPLAVNRGSITGRVALEGRTVHIGDVTADPEYTLSESTTLAGQRTALGVPLLREGQPVGVIVLARKRVEPFTEKQIELVTTFADQAVIAIENTRLITETREALEQQTATAEVLQVINSSPGDLAPVFDAMLDKSLRLCAAAFGFLWTWDGEQMHRLAFRGLPGELLEELRQPLKPPPGSIPERIVTGERVVFDIDVLEGPRRSPTLARLGARSCVGVALRNDEKLLGGITIYRREVRPFAEKQLALLENFAAQAVIAMENARLITETREALEQQTATAEVLQVINASPGDLTPVFNAILEKAHRLCAVEYGSLQLYDGDNFRAVATRGYPEQFAELLRQPYELEADNPLRAVLEQKASFEIPDVEAIEAQASNPRSQAALALGVRGMLFVPLVKDNSLRGLISAGRTVVGRFTDSQISLLQNFAAQAVIAIENARLITETREALEQQTATAEVLQVINSSPGDLAPVFDAILEKAKSLCGAKFGLLFTYDGQQITAAALHNIPSGFATFLMGGAVKPAPGTALARAIKERNPVQITDVMASEAYRAGDPFAIAAVEFASVHTVLAIPLVKEEAVLGVIAVYREEVQPFTDTQIALLQNFAAQAVIAMENARLITETREALEQQTATAEVLGVINSSPGDLAPVFDVMLEKATGLCEAPLGTLWLYDGRHLDPVATRGASPEFADFLRRGPHKPNPVQERQLGGEGTIHLADLKGTALYRDGDTLARAVADLGGIQTVLSVPLRREDRVLGLFGVYRQEQRPFSEKQMALIENFAAQAVIAIENARLINETREALEQQTATAEVLGVINSSPGDLGPVFDAILEKAHSLCGAEFGGLLTYDGESVRLAAERNLPPAWAELVRGPWLPRHDHPVARIIRGERLFQIEDMAELARTGDDPMVQAAVQQGGIRTLLLVPLRKDGAFLGYITAYRQEVRPFTEKQIALLQSFAAQAVIAMENARLINETQEALDQQTATAEVLGVINASPGDLTPVFDAMLEKAMRLCGAAFGQLATFDGKRFRTAATRGVPSAFAAYRRNNPPNYGPGTTPARILQGERVICTEDLKAELAYGSGEPNRQALVDLGGARSAVMVGLRKEDEVLGFIEIYRQEVRPFSDKQVSLLENFAAQAEIAIENARLLNEIRQRQAELRVTFDNMGDGVVMFDEHLRLAAWNRNLQEMLDLPDALLAERLSYSDYLRILAERGEFGTDDVDAEVSRRLEHIDQEFRSERTRPDGRVIEVRRNTVPDGGFVLIYSDVTERKRSEAEIRAARDGAEAAYHDLKAAQTSLIQAQKMAALGQLTAGIAHEIKNPLNFVNNFAGLSVELLDELKESTAPAIKTLDEDTRGEIDDTIEMLTGNLEKIVEHGQRADGIVKSMLEHSRGVTSERRKVDLNSLVEEALNLTYHGARAQDQNFNITLEREYDRNIGEIAIIPQEVNRVFINLIGNGFYAAHKRQQESADASFRPILKVETRDLGQTVEVRIRDNGIGIPGEIKDKLFQPFFTTKPTGEGTGLGLSISYDIVTQQHGGHIEVESQVGEFTEFIVRLPREYRAAAEAAS
jgi:GAF domain-containing protein